MGLNIYFYNKLGDEVEYQEHLGITHNLNKIADLIEHEKVLVQYLPSNGFGSFEDLIRFLCDYLKECYTHQDAYIYCCR